MPGIAKVRPWPHCPRCVTRLLDPIESGWTQIDTCRRCGGLWFDEGELQRILHRGDYSGAMGRLIDAEHDGPGVATRHACADCGAALARHELDRTGVALERCGSCGGIWLEQGMLERLQQIRDGEAALREIEKPTTRENWMFEFLSGLPVEFNLRPRRAPLVTYGLIVVNVLAFVAVFAAGGTERALTAYALVPADFPGAPWWLALLTSQFVHAGVVHLAGNMYLLWVLGDNVEDVFGRASFLAFYLFCGCVGGLAQTLAGLGSEVPMVGASGAVAGLAAAYATIFRRAKLTFMVFVVQYKISVLWYWGMWVAFNALGAGLGVFGVGWFAHLGGFAAGLAVAALVYRRVLAANPVLAYLNQGAHLARSFRRPRRRRALPTSAGAD